MNWLILSLLASSILYKPLVGAEQHELERKFCAVGLERSFKPRTVGIMRGMKIGAGAHVIHHVSGHDGVFSEMSGMEVGAGAHAVNIVRGNGEALQRIRGSGKQAKNTITITQVITSIRSMGVGALTITDGEENVIQISADDNILPYCTPTYNGKEIVLQSKACNFTSITPIVYHVMLTAATRAGIASLIAQSPVSIKVPIGSLELTIEHTDNNPLTCEAALKLQELIIKQSGAGSISLASIAIAKQFTLAHTTAGSLTVSGSAPQALFNLLGRGDIDASQLRIDTLLLHHAGAGSLQCCVNQTLTGIMNGAGSVENYGQADNPILNRRGLGSYTKIAPSEAQ